MVETVEHLSTPLLSLTPWMFPVKTPWVPWVGPVKTPRVPWVSPASLGSPWRSARGAWRCCRGSLNPRAETTSRRSRWTSSCARSRPATTGFSVTDSTLRGSRIGGRRGKRWQPPSTVLAAAPPSLPAPAANASAT